MKENKSVVNIWNLTYIKSKCRCPALPKETDLPNITDSNKFITRGTTPENLNSNLAGWATVKFFDIVYQWKTNFNQHHS